MREAHSRLGPDGQCASLAGSRGFFRKKGLRGSIAAHPRGDWCVQPVACKEDRAFPRDLLKRAASAGTALLLHACAASDHAVASFDHRASPRDRALPLADLPQPPRGLRVLCLGARRPLLLVREVSPAHIRNVWRGGKPHKGFCALLGLRDTGLRIVIPKSISRPLLRLNPVATSPGWKQFAVTPVPSRRRASSVVNRILASLVSQ